MTSQIFKSKYPIQGLFDFLELYSEKKTNYYYFTKTKFLLNNINFSFKKKNRVIILLNLCLFQLYKLLFSLKIH